MGLLVLFVLLPAAAFAARVPVDAQAKLFLKIASYDKNLPERELGVAVVHPPSAVADAASIVGALEALASVKVSGRSFSVQATPVSSPEDVEQVARGGPLYALYVAPSVPDALIPGLRRVAQKRGWLVFAAEPRHVALGATVAVEQDEQRRNILLNAGAALEQGRKFEAGFLGLCKIVR